MTTLTLVSVRIGTQEFAIDAMAVREIRGWTQPTPLPHAPHYVCGLSDLRGRVIPLIDLGARLGLQTTEATPYSVVIVAETADGLSGLLVDAVCELFTIEAGAVQPTPKTGSPAPGEVLLGVVELGGRIVGLIALEALIPAGLEEVA